MSITSPDDRSTHYSPVVLTTVFPADFPVFDDDDLAVFVNGQRRFDFDVTATYDDGISTDAVVVFDPGVIGEVYVVGQRSPRRSNRFQEGGPLPIANQNLALDTVEAELQELARESGRSVKVKYGDPEQTLPTPQTNAFLAWDEFGRLVNRVASDDDLPPPTQNPGTPVFIDIQAAKDSFIPTSVSVIETRAFNETLRSRKGGGLYRRSSLAEILRMVTPEIPDSTELFVPMHGPDGAIVAYDLSPNARPITRFGSVVVSDDHTYYDQNMSYFDGLGDTLTVPASADFAPTYTFAASIGVCVEDLTAERPLFSWTTDSTHYIAWVIKTDGSVEFRQKNGATNNIEVTSAPGKIVPGQVVELGLARFGADKWSIVKRDPSKHNNPSEIIATVADSSPLSSYTGTFRIGQLQATGATFKGWLGQFWFKADPSWEGAEDYILMPGESYFQSADGAWWLLDPLLVNPEMFGAAGDAVMNKDTGAISGTNDRIAIRQCRDFCAITGKEMRLVAKYWWTFGEWVWRDGCIMQGANRRKHGIYYDTDRTQAGIMWVGEGNVIRECFLSPQTPKGIQNGQGYYGTTVTFSRPVQRPKTRHAVEPAADYALRCSPGPVSGEIRNVRALRRKGGTAHCFCATSRTKSILIENVDAFGWSPSDGRFGSFLLTHWGFVGKDFPIGVDDIVIEPFITPIEPDTFTMHPSGVRVKNFRLRYVGRLYNSSASYDVELDGFSYVGTKNDSSGDGGQIIAHTCGDEWDMYAHPDDKGNLWANLVVKNGTGRILEASNPNASDRALISMVSTANSKTLNIDGTAAKDDLMTVETYTPGVIANGGGTVVRNVAVPGVVVADAAKVRAWFSKLGDDDDETGPVLSATVVTDGFIRVTFTNNRAAALNFTTPGTLTAYLPKKRKEYMGMYSGIDTRNIRCYGAGGTGNIMYLRNGQGQATFDNIQYLGELQTDGLSIQNWRGPVDIRNCKFPGDSDIGSAQGISIASTRFESTATISVDLGAGEASDFVYGKIVTGGTSGVTGVVVEIHDSNTLYIRLAKNGGRVFSTGETLASTDADGDPVSGTVVSVGSNATAALKVRGSQPTMTLSANLAKYGEVLQVNSIPADLRPGDKLSYAGGMVEVIGYHDVLETSVDITPAPAAASSGATITIDRRSSVSLRDVDIVGGYRGLEANNCDLFGSKLRIARQWQFGLLQDVSADINIDDLVFEGNGLARVALDTGMLTNDYCAQSGCGGKLSGRNWKFRDGKFVHTNFRVPANSLLQASLRDSTFVATGGLGAALNKSDVTSPLSGGAAFSQTNNVDTAGAAVTL